MYMYIYVYVYKSITIPAMDYISVCVVTCHTNSTK